MTLVVVDIKVVKLGIIYSQLAVVTQTVLRP